MNALRLAAWLILALALLGTLLVEGLAAQDREPPYWAAIRYDGARMRVGPSRDFPIEWVYTRVGLPVMVIRQREGWRLVRDPDGAQGWISANQLRRDRMVLVQGNDPVALRTSGEMTSEVRWRAEPGVLGRLLQCEDDWCEIDVDGRTGWVEAARIWGEEEPIADE